MGIFNSLGEAFSNPGASLGKAGPVGDIAAKFHGGIKGQENSATTDLALDKGAYTPDPNNWYTAKPYGFRFADRKTGRSSTMFLPISPSNLNIVTNFATNVIPTLYGTVEEHSAVRYYDIVIEGTTGMTPKFTEPGYVGNTGQGVKEDVAYSAQVKQGRARFPIASAAPLGGFFSSTIGAITNVLNQAGKAVDTILGGSPTETGVYNNQTGYIAFHNLYRFLLKYKKDAAGIESNVPRIAHPLTFFNYKDGNEYSVAIRNFTLRRSAENPMLYFYSITMRGYNLRQVGGKISSDDLTQRLTDLGLDGVQSSSLLSKIKSVSSNAKAVVGSVKNGINLFGR